MHISLRRMLAGGALLGLSVLTFGPTGLALSTGVASTTSANSSAAFQDVPTNYPNLDAIAYLKDKGIVKGYTDGNFLPDNTVNRAEFMKILIGGVTTTPKGSNCFTDVHDEWFAPYVCEAKSRGVVSGYSDGSFKPGLNINVVEASKMVTKAFEIKNTTATPTFKQDVWYKPFVETLASKSAIPVSIDYPEKKLTRGEMAEMTWRVKADVTTKPTKTMTSLTAELPMISSCSELKEKVAVDMYRGGGDRPMLMKSEVANMAEDSSGATGATGAPEAPASATPDAAVTGGKGSGSESPDYSTTNVQVAGVDEADIVKNDGQYIYMIKGRSIRIVQAAPVGEMKELSRVVVDDTSYYPTEMFVTGGTLVAVGNTYDQKIGTTQTVVYIYDVTDRSNAKQVRRLSFEGSYVSSRRIGGHAYFVMNAYPRYQLYDNLEKIQPADIVPTFTDSKSGATTPVVGCDAIRIFPRYDQPNFLVVAGVSLDNAADASVVRQAYLGSGNTVYSSAENLYVATEKYRYNDFATYNIWAPPITQVSTELYRFELSNGNVTYKTTGEVPGTLLNQYSMDEKGDTFRLATSVGDFWSGSANQPNNQLYVLNKNNLGTTLGKVDDIGKGEKIKAVRFMGERAYVVTFKNTDPFFVIDLSNASVPKILGELKIPGYSDYLHPYDENHIIGFGKEAVDASQFPELNQGGFVPGGDNFAWYQGMKLAMFDVTDPTNPKEMFKEVIGDRGTQSELLYNPKALLFSKERGLLAFPIEVAEIKDKSGKPNPSAYGETVFRGAYVYGVDLVNGFTLKGKLTHVEASDFTTPDMSSGGVDGGGAMTKIWNPGNGGPWFSNYEAVISRLIYIGNSIYTISMKRVDANSLTDLSAQGSVKLQKEPEDPNTPVIMY